MGTTLATASSAASEVPKIFGHRFLSRIDLISDFARIQRRVLVTEGAGAGTGRFLELGLKATTSRPRSPPPDRT